jgi:hypothetical protein
VEEVAAREGPGLEDERVVLGRVVERHPGDFGGIRPAHGHVRRPRSDAAEAVDDEVVILDAPRGVAIEAGSTTWLSMPFCCRTRCSQNPSSPASWIVMIG